MSTEEQNVNAQPAQVAPAFPTTQMPPTYLSSAGAGMITLGNNMAHQPFHGANQFTNAMPYSFNSYIQPPMYMNPQYTMAPPVSVQATEPQTEDESKEETSKVAEAPAPIPVQPAAPTIAYNQPMSYAGAAYRPSYQPVTIRYPPQYSNQFMARAPGAFMQSAVHMPTMQQPPVTEQPQAERSQESQVSASQPGPPLLQAVAAPVQSYMMPQPQPTYSYAAPFTTRSTLMPQSYSYQPTVYQSGYPGSYQTVNYPYTAPVVADNPAEAAPVEIDQPQDAAADVQQ